MHAIGRSLAPRRRVRAAFMSTVKGTSQPQHRSTARRLAVASFLLLSICTLLAHMNVRVNTLQRVVGLGFALIAGLAFSAVEGERVRAAGRALLGGVRRLLHSRLTPREVPVAVPK